MLNTLNAELNPICLLLALLGARHIFHVSGLRVKLLHGFPPLFKSQGMNFLNTTYTVVLISP